MNEVLSKRWINKYFIFAILLIFLPFRSSAQEKATEIDKFMSWFDDQGFNGAVLVSDNNQNIYRKAFGLANVENNITNTTKTRFRIGSLTKPFTATLVLRLVEEGYLDLHEPISTYLPEYQGKNKEHITIHHLLTHTSGLSSYSLFPEFTLDFASTPISPKNLVAFFSGKDLLYDPGKGQKYSNSGYSLLGYIIEEVTGLSYSRAMKKLVLDPLKLFDTGVASGHPVEELAGGYSNTYLGIKRSPYWHPSVTYSAGAMYSTLDDLLKWVNALSSGKLFKNPETFQMMITPHLKRPPYGYGWQVRTDTSSAGNHSIRHNGSYIGYRVQLTHDVKTKTTLIIAENSNGGTTWKNHGIPVAEGYHRSISKGLMKIMNSVAPELPKQSIGELLVSEYNNGSLDSALELYKEHYDNAIETFDMSSFELAILSYQYLKQGNYEAARSFAELNIKYHPDDAMAYFGLIESLVYMDEMDRALDLHYHFLKLKNLNTLPLQVLARIRKYFSDFDENPLQTVIDKRNIIVYKKQGRYGGWPANNGIWSWGNEIVVGFDDGLFHLSDRNLRGRGHAIDYSKPVRSAIARSLDGGETWTVEWPKGLQPPPDSKIFGIPTSTIGNPTVDIEKPIPFSNPDLALTFRTSYTDKLNESYFYWSVNRGKTWNGPYRLPLFHFSTILARTDYLIQNNNEAVVMLPAYSKSGGSQTIAIMTEDGGLNWELKSSYDGGNQPSTVRLTKNELLTTVRQNVSTDSSQYQYITSYRSLDNGNSWEYAGQVVQTHNPPDLIRLRDGRLVITYGFRGLPWRGIRAKISDDNGRSWGSEIILRDDGGNHDLGYSKSVQRNDGKIVTVYYFNDSPRTERYIAATIWDPGGN